ncbi:MAG: hypothetical protein QXD03_03960 [Candidatus Anstonellales archaeon]
MRNLVGGGEILKYTGGAKGKVPVYLDENMVKAFKYMPYAKVIIIIGLFILALYLIYRILDMKLAFKGKGLINELDYMKEIKRKDAYIIRMNKLIADITNLIESSPLKLDISKIDYYQYNLNRAGVKIIGGERNLKAQEFNAIMCSLEIITILLAIVISVFFSVPLGALLIMISLIGFNTLPMILLRNTVKAKDNEIRENFFDMYSGLHYIIKNGAGTSLTKLLKSYGKTTHSKEMKRFVDAAIHYIDNYGEYEATRYIAKDYREIAEIGRLMRLIRQVNEGADVKIEIEGFRTELMKDEKHRASKRRQKLVEGARASFILAKIILFQAIVSAMSIYLKDLGLVKGLVGK